VDVARGARLGEVGDSLSVQLAASQWTYPSYLVAVVCGSTVAGCSIVCFGLYSLARYSQVQLRSQFSVRASCPCVLCQSGINTARGDGVLSTSFKALSLCTFLLAPIAL
jgi:hypothetical protein